MNIRSDKSKYHYNELEFLSWGEFQQMGPTILQLEITRLGTMIQSVIDDTDFYNRLVRARFALQQFNAALPKAEKTTAEQTCSAHLRTAIVNISFQPDDLDAESKRTCDYILDRLTKINDRMQLLY